MSVRALASKLMHMNVCNKLTADLTQKAGSFFVVKHKGQFIASSPKYGNAFIGSRNFSTVLKPNSEDDNEIDWATLGLSKEKIEIDNMLINWDKVGNGEHVVLLLPGIVGCIRHDFFPMFLKMDKTKYTLVSWDPPGYGRSRPPMRDFSGVFYRRDGEIVVKLMDKLGYDKFSILGWSNGGITGGYIAGDHPSRVHRLVTWGSHAYADKRAVEFTQSHGLNPLGLNLDFFRNDALPQGMKDGLGIYLKFYTCLNSNGRSEPMCERKFWAPSMLEPVESLYGTEYLFQMMRDWHQAVTDFHNAGLDVTFKEALSKIQCPTLAIHGEKDPVLGVEHAKYLRDNIANSAFWLMPKGKHNMHLRFPDEFLDVVTYFLDADGPRATDMLKLK